MLKKYKPYIILFYILAVGGLIAAAFFDLKLDILLNNPNNPIAIWFCNTGEMPSRLVCPLAGAILYYTCEKKWQKIGGLIIELGGSAYLGYHISNYFFAEDNQILFGVIYGIGFGLVLLLAGKYMHFSNKTLRVMRKLAVIGIIVMFAQIIIIEGSKFLWGRVRFRDLLVIGSYDAFTPWYHPNGINGNKSFPSGHTAGAGISYLMMFMPVISRKWQNKHGLCFIIPCVYTSVVAFTRLVMGAHYLSDVTVGGLVSFTIVIIAIAVYERKK